MSVEHLNVLLLAGGVGGAKMAEGLNFSSNISLTILGNIGDDDSFHGLWVSPDIDTMIYTLSDEINKTQGWGVKDDDYKALSFLSKLGNNTWMSLGDKDLGLHIYRTERLRRGDRASDIVKDIAEAFGVKHHIILPTDDIVQTKVLTDQGWLTFQEYFVKERCSPVVKEIEFDGLNIAKPTHEALEAISMADLILIAPSNPFVSISPILNIPGILDAIKECDAIKLAVSPLINGKAIKGPAEKMMISLGLQADSIGVANFYKDLIDGIIIDSSDAELALEIKSLGMQVFCTNILMSNNSEKRRLAGEILDIAKNTNFPNEVNA